MKKTPFFYFLVSLVFIGACKKSNDSGLSSKKAIVSFTASNSGISSMPVSIDNDKYTIAISAQCPTNQTAIKVSPGVSDKATCSLAQGTVLDLSGTKKFTITAEDGTKQEYSVFVQGCSLYSSYFYKNCTVKRVIPCVVQDNKQLQVSGSSIFLSFKELPESGTSGFLDENDFKISFTLANTDFKTGTPKTYNIEPYNGVGSKASFVYKSLSDGGLLPSGTLNITNIDVANRLISGNFKFDQAGDGNGFCKNYDYLLGEFYSVPY
jgi:hypothetical protein